MELDLPKPVATEQPKPTRIEASAPGSTMPRPKESDDAIMLAAAREFAPFCARWDPSSTPDDWVEALYKARHHWDDGYRLARALEDGSCVMPDAALVEILDGAGFTLSRVRDREVRLWVGIVGFEPRYAVGDKVKWPRGEGVVSDIEVDTARYVIAKDGATRGGTLVDAELVEAAQSS